MLKIGLFGLLIAYSSTGMAWPWGDASKYRNECKRTCIEDSFGKANAREIDMRCSSKCNVLPYSPKDQWEFYDHCTSFKNERRLRMLKLEPLRIGCESTLNKKLKGCEKDKLYKEICEREIKQSESNECKEAWIAKMEHDYADKTECNQPEVRRPNR